MDAQAKAVLDFWFGADTDPGHAQPREQWFRKDATFDARIERRFGALIGQALSGGIDGWAQEPASALARVIVLDQFTRNVFRDTARAFAGDAGALAAARRMVRDGADRRLLPVQRMFVYLPFEHAEDLAMQQEALRLYGQLAADDPARADLLPWAQKHHDVIARFGRFPHRNAALGRTSTDEEARFLTEPGSRF